MGVGGWVHLSEGGGQPTYQGSEILAEILSKEYFTYYIILSILLQSIIAFHLL